MQKLGGKGIFEYRWSVQLLSKPRILPQNKLMGLTSWIRDLKSCIYGFDVQRTLFHGDLSIHLQRQQWLNDFFLFHSTGCSPGLTILRGKNCALSESVYFLILYPTNICSPFWWPKSEICYIVLREYDHYVIMTKIWIMIIYFDDLTLQI